MTMEYIMESKVIAGIYLLATPVGTYRVERINGEWFTSDHASSDRPTDVYRTKKDAVTAIHNHVLDIMSDALNINASMGTNVVPIKQKGNPLQVDTSVPVHRDSVAILIAILSVHEWQQQGKRSLSYGTEYVPTATHSGIGQRITMSPPMSAKGNGPRQYAFRMWIESYADRSAIQVAKESKAIHSEVTAFKDESSPQSCWPMKEWSQDWDADRAHTFKAPSDKRARVESVVWCRKCGYVPNTGDSEWSGTFNSRTSRRERIAQQSCDHSTQEITMAHGADVGTTAMVHNIHEPKSGKVLKTWANDPSALSPSMETDREHLVTKLNVRPRKVVSDFDATPSLPDMDMIGIGRQLIGSGKRRVRVSLARADQGKVIKGRLTVHGIDYRRKNGGRTFPYFTTAIANCSVVVGHARYESDPESPIAFRRRNSMSMGIIGQSGTPEFREWWNETIGKLSNDVGIEILDSWKYRFSTEFHHVDHHRQSMAQFFEPIAGPRMGEVAPHFTMVHWITGPDGAPFQFNSDGTKPKVKGNGSGGKIRRRRSAKQIKADTKAKPKVTEIPATPGVETDPELMQTTTVPSKLRTLTKPTKRKPVGTKVVADAVAFDATKMLQRGLIG